VTDAHGHAFVNVAIGDAPASGLVEESASAGGCTAAEPGAHPLSPSVPTCPRQDLREIYYGLLGPDAVSLTYDAPFTGSRTIRTVGPQGAYLFVLAQPQYIDHADIRSGPGIYDSWIESVTYRDGRTCKVSRESLTEACPPVGYAPLATRALRTAQLTSPVKVHEIAPSSFCSDGATVVPCGAKPPARFQREALVQIAFRSRIALTGSRSFYETTLAYTPSHTCTGRGGSASTDKDIRAGETVLLDTFVPLSCPGPIRGTVAYVVAGGPAGPTPVVGMPGQNKPVTVGRFRIRTP
jgi:hypothetical protein